MYRKHFHLSEEEFLKESYDSFRVNSFIIQLVAKEQEISQKLDKHA